MFKKLLNHLLKVITGAMVLASVHCTWCDDDDHDYYDSARVDDATQQPIES